MFVLCSSVSVWYCTRCSSSQIANLLSRYFCFCMLLLEILQVPKPLTRHISYLFSVYCGLIWQSYSLQWSWGYCYLWTLVRHCTEENKSAECLCFDTREKGARWFLLSEACELKSVKQYATVSMRLWTTLSCWVCSSQTQGSLRMLCHCMDAMFTSCFLPCIIPH